MAQAGLGYVDPLRSAAGLNEPSTMQDTWQQRMALAKQGMTDDEIDQALGRTRMTPENTDEVEADDGMGLMGLAGYGARAFGESVVSGAAGFIDDRFGLDGLADGMEGVAEAIGPSEEQEQARAERAEGKGTLATGGDAIVQELPSIGAAILGGTAAGAAAGAVFGPGAVATAIGGGVTAGIGWLRIRDENRTSAQAGKLATQRAQAKYGANPTVEQIQEIQGTLTEEEIAAVELNDAEINKVDGVAAISAIPEAIAPIKGVIRLGGPAAKAAIGSALKKAAVEGGKDAMTEGVTEVAQEAARILAFDPAMRAKLDESEVQEIAPWVMKFYGKEAAVAFIAGAGLGGAAGSTTGGYAQTMANTQLKRQVVTMGTAAEAAGIQTERLEELARDPEKAKIIAEGAPAIAAAEQNVLIKRSELEALGPSASEATISEAEAGLKKAEKQRDKTMDDVLPKLGGKTAAEVRVDQAEMVEAKKDSALLALQEASPSEDFKAPKVETLEDANQYATVSSDYLSARAAREKSELKHEKATKGKKPERLVELNEARAAEADARATLAQKYEGADYQKTYNSIMQDFNTGRRDALMDRARSERDAVHQSEVDITKQELGVEDGVEPTPEAKAKAKEILAAHEENAQQEAAGTQKVQTTLDNKRKKYNTARGDRTKLRQEITDLEGQLEAREPPAVTAAREVLQAPVGDRAAEAPVQEDGTEATPTPEVTPKSADTAAQAEGGVSPAPAEITPEAASTVLTDAGIPATPGNIKKLRSSPDWRGQLPAMQNDAQFDRMTEDTGQALVVARKARSAAPKGDIAAQQDAEQAAENVLNEVGLEATPERVKKLSSGKGAWKNNLKSMIKKARAEAEVEVEAQGASELGGPLKPKANRDQGDQIDRQHRWKSIVSALDGMSMAEQDAELQRLTDESGNEYGAGWDEDGNLLYAGTNGHKNKIATPVRVLKEGIVRHLHTHPLASPPSAADMVLSAKMAGQVPDLEYIVSLPDQTVQYKVTNPEVDPAWITDVASPAVHQAVVDAVSEGQVRNDLDDIGYARISQEALLRHLENEGVIEFTQRMEGFDATEELEIERIVDAVRGVAYQSGPLTDVGAGTAQDVAGGRQAGGQRAGVQGEALPASAGKDPVYPEFRDAWAAGTPIDELIQRPEFTNAVGVMMTKPATSKSPDFDSDTWHANRRYNIDGREVVGTDTAVFQMIEGARNLAAVELKKPTKPVAHNRQLTIITGPPASGKSTIANEIAYDNDAAIIDSDEYKKTLPEFGRGEGANAVHKESKGLADTVEGVLMGQGANVVYPKVGHEKASIDKLANKWRNAGYTVTLVDLKVPTNEAMRRMLGRFAGSGRLIPPSYLLDEVGDNPSNVHQQMAQENLYDGYTQLDGLVPYGQIPTVLSSSGSIDPVAGTKFEVPGGQRLERGQSADVTGAAENNRSAAQGELISQALDPYAPKLPLPMKEGEAYRSVNEMAARDMGSKVHAAVMAGRKNKLQNAMTAGDITPQSVAEAIAVAADNDGQNAGLALRSIANKLIDAGEYSDQDRFNLALTAINEAGKVGAGKFKRTSETFYDPSKKSNVTVSTLSLDPDLRSTLQVEPEAARFSPPMSDPNNTENIKRKAGNLLEGPALERAEFSARHQQKQRYVLDHDYINGLTADQLISSKVVAKNDGHKKFLQRRAQVKLDRLKSMAEDWGDAELGFEYFIDKKGRLYPSGEFHHQSGDVIKAAFKIRMPDGSYTSLKNFNSVDHTGSGWQVAQGITRDEALAPLVNTQAGSASIPGDTGKGDMYGATRGFMTDRLRAKFGNEHPFVKKVVDGAISGKEWFGKFGRNMLKTPVLAVNYAGGPANFREALLDAYYSDVGKEVEGSFWIEAADVGYDAVGDMAPIAKAWKDWAVDGLQAGIDAAGEAGLTITVGPDGQYTIKKYRPVSKNMEATDNRADSSIKKIKATWKEPGETLDAQKTARNMFSQMIQGFDAAIMHETLQNYVDALGPDAPIVTNHDSYTVPPENAGILAAAVRKSMKDVIGNSDPGQMLREAILDQTGVDIGPPPPPGSWSLDEYDTSSPVFTEENEVTGQVEERPPYVGLDGEPLVSQAMDDAGRVSVRYPTLKTREFDPLVDLGQVGEGAMRHSEKAFDFNMETIRTYDGWSHGDMSAAETAAQFKKDAIANLLWLHDQFDPETRAATSRWYDGSRKIVEQFAAQYGKPPEVIAGVMASLSPQKDWFQNLSLGERVLDIMSYQQDTKWSPKMTAKASDIFGGPQYASAMKAIKGKKLSDLTENVHKSMWVRTYDEAHNPRGYREATTDGNWQGKPAGKAAWSSNAIIGKAISIIDNHAVENISAQLGGNHKVRSFYNNIVAPMSTDGDVTIDTHAVGAALMLPVSGNSPEVAHNFGVGLGRDKQPEGYRPPRSAGFTGAKGLYGLYADAYREAAAQRGILPRQMQSITWEAVRTLFDKNWKGPKNNAAVRSIWKRHANGEINADQARAEIADYAGGVPAPEWYGRSSGRDGAGERSSYAGRIPEAVLRERDVLAGAGRRGDDPGATAAGDAAGGRTIEPALVSMDGRGNQTDGGDVGAQRGVRPADGALGRDNGRVRGGVQLVDAAEFDSAMDRAVEALGPEMAQVSRVDPASNAQRYLLDDGNTGYALDGDNVIGVFSHPDAGRGAAQRVLADAVAKGGRRLDGFDTYLPKLYAKGGFKAVARLPFNPLYAPSVAEGSAADWDAAAMDGIKPGWGSPDVVFMVYDPNNANADTDNTVAEYEDGMSAQDAALEEIGDGQINDAGRDRGGEQEGAGGAGQAVLPSYEALNSQGIDEWLGQKPGVTPAKIHAEIQRLVDTGRSTPNAVMAGLRHDPTLFNYDNIMNAATRIDGRDYGPEFFDANAKFTLGMQAKLAQISRGMSPTDAKVYMDMGKAQLRDHQQKVVDAIHRGTIETADVDHGTKTYRVRDPGDPKRSGIGADQARRRAQARARSGGGADYGGGMDGVARARRPVLSLTSRGIDADPVEHMTLASAGMDKPDPKKTVKAYKLFRKMDGKLYPLFVDAEQEVPVGEWMVAKMPDAFVAENGRTYVPSTGAKKTGDNIKIPNKEVAQQLLDQGIIKSLNTKTVKAVAQRGGWHAGSSPFSTHIGPMQDGQKIRGDDEVWAEVEMPDDVDWQSEANNRAKRTKAGKIIPRTAEINDVLPAGGHYRYKTNPNMTGEWLIGGEMRVVKELSDAEVKQINDEAGVADLPRSSQLVSQGVDAPEGIKAFNKADGALKKMTERARGMHSDPKGELKKAGTELYNIGSNLEQKFVNRFAPIRTLEKLMNNGKLLMGSESAYKAAELAVNDSGRNEMLQFVGAAKLGKHGEFSTASGTVGLRTIFNGVTAGKKGDVAGQAMADWMGWMAARRIKSLQAKNPNMKFPMKDVDAALAKEQPQFQEAADQWRAHNSANIDFLVDTGRINKAQAKAMKDDEFYVPFYRSDDKVNAEGVPEFQLPDNYGGRGASGEIMSRNPGIHKLIGGDKMMIDNIMLNMISNSQAMVAAGMRNQAANQIFDLMTDAGLAKKTKATKKGKSKAFVRREKPRGAVSMWKDGQEVYVVPEAGAEPLMLAMTALQPLQLGTIGKLMAGVGAFFRQGVTLSPAFIVRNAFRGAVSAGILTSGSNMTLRNNFFTGVKDAYRNGDATRAFKAQSGMGDFRFGNATSGLGANDILVDYGLGPKTAGYRLRKVLDGVEQVGTATELADRVAAYNTMIENGVRPDEAAYRALNIINYGRKGASGELRAALPMIPFLNARIQGLARFAEGATSKDPVARRQAFTQLMLNGLVLAALSGVLWARNALDDENREKYKNEPLHRRLNYHIIYVGDKTVLLPKAFEIGHAFSSLPELLGDAAFNNMGDQVGPGVKKIVADTLLFNAIPQAIMPLIEGQANYSFFRQRQIEGMRETNLMARDRMSDASALSQFIGRKLGLSDTSVLGAESILGAENGRLSPAMIEHYLQGYGGAMYGMLAAVTDMIGAEVGLIPPKPGGAFGATPLVSNAANNVLGSMFKDQGEYSSRYVGDFYDMKDYITQIHRSAKAAADAGNVEYAQKLIASAPATPSAYKLVNRAARDLGKINAAIREVSSSTKLTASQKQTQLRKLIPQRNQLTGDVVRMIQEMEEKQGRTFKSAS